MGYTVDITPTEGVFVGSDFKFKVTALDSNKNPITGASGNITIEIKEPDGSTTTKSGNDLTDEGDGVYSFTFTTSQEGYHYATWTFDGSNKRVVEVVLLVEELN